MAQESYHIIPEKLANYRHQAELTQGELAERAGLCLRQYQRIEKDGRTTKQRAKSLARALGIELCTGQNFCRPSMMGTERYELTLM